MINLIKKTWLIIVAIASFTTILIGGFIIPIWWGTTVAGILQIIHHTMMFKLSKKSFNIIKMPISIPIEGAYEIIKEDWEKLNIRI